MSVVKIEFNIPTDNTFTNLLLYEGILYLFNEAPPTISGNQLVIELEDLREVYRTKLDDERIERIKLQMAGNDKRGPVQKLLRLLNLHDVEKRVTDYGTLLRLVKDNIDDLPISQEIKLKLSTDRTSKNKGVYIGDVISKEQGISFQLFKTERYTGFTSTEFGDPSEQLTTYLSKEAILLALLGIYSSFVTRVTEKDRTTYYFFLLFSADEAMEILSLGKEVASEKFLVKNVVRDVLSDVFSRAFTEELLIAELLANVRIRERLEESGAIEGVSMLLFKIAQEGQTYKIYEQIPTIVYKRGRHEPLRIISDILDPKDLILERLKNRENIEYSNLLAAIIGLYRFVVLDDKQGLLIMLREIHNAYHKVRTDEKLRRISQRYERLIRELSHVARIL